MSANQRSQTRRVDVRHFREIDQDITMAVQLPDGALKSEECLDRERSTATEYRLIFARARTAFDEESILRHHAYITPFEDNVNRQFWMNLKNKGSMAPTIPGSNRPPHPMCQRRTRRRERLSAARGANLG